MSATNTATDTPAAFDLINHVKGKPSIVVRATINGLRNALRRPNFLLDMRTFGRVSDSSNLCIGCMATCALQEITNTQFHSDEITTAGSRSEYVGLPYGTVDRFERVVDLLRGNLLYPLYNFCAVDAVQDDLPLKLYPFGMQGNDGDYLLDGCPSDDQTRYAIDVLERFAIYLETKGF